MIHSPSLSLKDIALEYFNVLFGKSARSDEYWNGELRDCIRRKYPSGLAEAETQSDFDLRTSISLPLLFEQLKRRTGVRFGDKFSKQYPAQEDKEKELSFFFQASETPFSPDDIVELDPVIKITRVVPASGTAVGAMDTSFEEAEAVGYSAAVQLSDSFISQLYKKQLDIREAKLGKDDILVAAAARYGLPLLLMLCVTQPPI